MKKEIIDGIRLHLLKIYLEENNKRKSDVKFDILKGGEIQNEI